MLLQYLDWGHVTIYLVGVIFLVLEGMPVFMERNERSPSAAQAYLFLLQAMLWPLVAVYLVVRRVYEDIRE